MPIYHLPDTHQADTQQPDTHQSSRPSEPRRAIRHIVALKLAANAVARYEYETELWQLTQAQQRICEGLAATAIGAYMAAVQKTSPREPR
jgi:hypothetical protein